MIITEENKENFAKNNKYRIAIGSIGSFSGIAYSVYNKTGFWKGLGYTILFGIAGSYLGTGIDSLTKK